MYMYMYMYIYIYMRMYIYICIQIVRSCISMMASYSFGAADPDHEHLPTGNHPPGPSGEFHGIS